MGVPCRPFVLSVEIMALRALYIDANSRGEYYDPTGRPPFLRAYVNFLNKHCTSWTYNTIRVQEEGSIV